MTAFLTEVIVDCDLKWWHAATRGIIIFPVMQQHSIIESSLIPKYAIVTKLIDKS